MKLERLGVTLALVAAFPVEPEAQLSGPYCAEVKLEIVQEATLEREAFDARLVIDNNVADQAFTNLRVSIFMKDEQGASANRTRRRRPEKSRLPPPQVPATPPAPSSQSPNDTGSDSAQDRPFSRRH